MNVVKLLFWNIDRPLDCKPFISRILQNNPDIIVLIEVRLKRKEGKRSIPVGIIPFEELTKIYDYIIHEPKDVPDPREDGIAIFWRKEMFEHLASDKHFRPMKAIYVKLKHIESDTYLNFLPIHLKAGYNSGEDKRVDEIKRCTDFLRSRESETAVICGDFNDDLKEERKLSAALKRENFKIWEGIPTCLVHDRWWSFDRIVTLGYLDVKYSIEPNTSKEYQSDHIPVEVHLSW